MSTPGKSEEDRTKVRRWTAAITGVLLLVVTFVVTYFTGVIWFPRYTPEQWAAAGGWVGGIGTIAAVTVALLQAHRAKEKSRKDEADNAAKLEEEKERHNGELLAAESRLSDELAAADRRHREQLDQANEHAEQQRHAAEERYRGQLNKSDELLKQELDEQRRLRQVDALGLIWNAISAVEIPANNMTVNLTRTQLLQLRYQQVDPGTPGYAEVDKKVREAAQDFQTALQQFAPVMMAAEISFTTAMMVVDEPKTLKVLEDTYQAFIDFRKLLTESVNDSLQGIPVDVKSINDAKSQLNKLREPMIKVVRENLTRARPLREFQTRA